MKRNKKYLQYEAANKSSKRKKNPKKYSREHKRKQRNKNWLSIKQFEGS